MILASLMQMPLIAAVAWFFARLDRRVNRAVFPQICLAFARQVQPVHSYALILCARRIPS
jgi:hypothetical protein